MYHFLHACCAALVSYTCAVVSSTFVSPAPPTVLVPAFDLLAAVPLLSFVIDNYMLLTTVSPLRRSAAVAIFLCMTLQYT